MGSEAATTITEGVATATAVGGAIMGVLAVVALIKVLRRAF
jgi:hypothetical protein